MFHRLLFLVCGLLLCAESAAWAGRLELYSKPRGAQVFVGGSFRGRTPLVVQLRPGRYHVEVRQKSFLTWTSYVIMPERADLSLRVRLESGSGDEPSSGVPAARPRVGLQQGTGQMIQAPSRPNPTSASKTLGRSGLLLVRSKPSGISVYKNDRLLGRTPLLVQMPVGFHNLSFRQAGYARINRRVQIKISRSTKLMVKMSSSNGGAEPKKDGGGFATQLLILCKPNAKAYLNGRLVGSTPFISGGLTPGRYVLKLKKPGYVTYQKVIRLYSGQNMRLKILLVPSSRKR